jgi:hypothetical protein
VDEVPEEIERRALLALGRLVLSLQEDGPDAERLTDGV